MGPKSLSFCPRKVIPVQCIATLQLIGPAHKLHRKPNVVNIVTGVIFTTHNFLHNFLMGPKSLCVFPVQFLLTLQLVGYTFTQKTNCFKYGHWTLPSRSTIWPFTPKGSFSDSNFGLSQCVFENNFLTHQLNAKGTFPFFPVPRGGGVWIRIHNLNINNLVPQQLCYLCWPI